MLTARWDCPGCNRAFTDADELATLLPVTLNDTEVDEQLFGMCERCAEHLDDLDDLDDPDDPDDCDLLIQRQLARVRRCPQRYARPPALWAGHILARLEECDLHPLLLAQQFMLVARGQPQAGAEMLNAMGVRPPVWNGTPPALRWSARHPALQALAYWEGADRADRTPIVDDAPGRRSGVLGLWLFDPTAVAQAAHQTLAHAGWERIYFLPHEIAPETLRGSAYFHALRYLAPLLRMDKLRVIVSDPEDALAPTDAEIFDDGNWFGETAWALWYGYLLGIDCAVLSPTGELVPEPWRALRQTCIPERTALVLHEHRQRFRQRRHLQLVFEESADAPIRDAETGYWLGWQELLAALPVPLVRRLARWNHDIDMAQSFGPCLDQDKEAAEDERLDAEWIALHQALQTALPAMRVERGVDWDDPNTVRPAVAVELDDDADDEEDVEIIEIGDEDDFEPPRAPVIPLRPR